MSRARLMVIAICSALSLTVVGGCASDSSTRSAGRVIDDATITAKVKAALADAPDVAARNVNVTTYRGVVQLSGFVNSSNEIARAASVARQIEGVRSVENDLKVVAPAS
jgi:hyperosmotically inducible protein